LTGALAPASLAGDISLGAFVSRIAADLRTGLETDADGNDDEEDEDEGGGRTTTISRRTDSGPTTNPPRRAFRSCTAPRARTRRVS
jgi:hypothetical protein